MFGLWIASLVGIGVALALLSVDWVRQNALDSVSLPVGLFTALFLTWVAERARRLQTDTQINKIRDFHFSEFNTSLYNVSATIGENIVFVYATMFEFFQEKFSTSRIKTEQVVLDTPEIAVGKLAEHIKPMERQCDKLLQNMKDHNLRNECVVFTKEEIDWINDLKTSFKVLGQTAWLKEGIPPRYKTPEEAFDELVRRPIEDIQEVCEKLQLLRSNSDGGLFEINMTETLSNAKKYLDENFKK